MLISWVVEIISQCIGVSKHHVNLYTIFIVNHASIRLEKRGWK